MKVLVPGIYATCKVNIHTKFYVPIYTHTVYSANGNCWVGFCFSLLTAVAVHLCSISWLNNGLYIGRSKWSYLWVYSISISRKETIGLRFIIRLLNIEFEKYDKNPLLIQSDTGVMNAFDSSEKTNKDCVQEQRFFYLLG